MRSFNVIAARNFGEKGDVLESIKQTLGEAAITVNANALNGNLLIKDHLLTYKDRGVHLNIGMVYNSQLSQPWKLNLGKQIINVKEVNISGSEINLLEEDGSQTTFLYDQTRKCYVEVGATNGARTLTFDGTKWQGWDPKTGAIDSYDQTLKLTETAYLDGASIEYHYDTNGRLTSLRTTSGQYLEIEEANNEIKIWHNQDGKRIFWVTYQLDEQKKLIATCIPLTETETYTTTYEHDQRTGLLRYITQSDNTKLEFDYQLIDSRVKVCKIVDGEGRKYDFNYQTKQTSCVDPLGQTTTFIRNEQNKLQECTDGLHKTSYQYDKLHRVEKISYVDGTTKKFEYDDLSFCKKQVDRNGSVTYFKHDQKTGVFLGRKQAGAVSAYYYNTKRQLRYEVTPIGGVIEYLYDQFGNRRAKKEFLSSFFELGGDLQAWLKTLDKQNIALTEWHYHSTGLLEREIRYGTIDKNGHGVLDEYASVETYEWDTHANCSKKTKKLDELGYAITTIDHDGLSRSIEERDPLGRIVRYGYKGSSCTVSSLATGHESIIRKDKSGQIVKDVECADGLTRQTINLLDKAGRCYAKQQDDGSKTYYVYDKQNRKKFEIDAEKRVTEFSYDVNDNITSIARYAKPIVSVDEDALSKGTWEPKVTGEKKLERKIYDAEGQLKFSVDGENFVTEYRYDARGNLTDKILYASACTSDLSPKTSEKDRHYRYFYNKDDTKRAEQFPNGQLIVYSRNARGELLEKTKYVTPQNIGATIEVEKLLKCGADQTERYVLDARGLCIEHTDAEGIVTTSEYDAGGRRKLTKKETLEIEYEYDELDRITLESHSTGLEISTLFHPNGEVRYQERKDRFTKSESQEQYFEYNGFGEQTQTLTDKLSIARLLKKLSKASRFSTQIFGDVIEQAVGERKDELKSLDLWNALYLHLVADKYLNKDNAASILDEMERHQQFFSDQADKQENLPNLIRFFRLYCAALNIFILKGSWRTYLGGKLHLEFVKNRFFPVDFNFLPHTLDKAKEILKTISSIPKTNDLTELQSIKKYLVEIKELLNSSLGNKGFWRHDATHDFYDKTVKTLEPLSLEDTPTLNIDETNFYSPDGLLTCVQDNLGHKTHFFYDALQRPVLMVYADRAIVSLKYDVYSDHVQETRYFAKFLPKEEKAKLKGGLLSPELAALFDQLKSDKDTLVIDKHDKRQLLVEKIDGEVFSEKDEYNAFGEIEKKTKVIDKKTSEVTVDAFEYDPIGREIKVTKDVNGLVITKSTEYHDAEGLEIATDGCGNQTKHYYDRLHRLTKLIDAVGGESRWEWDGLGRLKSTLNQLKQIICHEWSADGRSVKIISPSSVQIIERNAFGSVTSDTKVLSSGSITQTTQYNDSGKIKSIQDANGETTFHYDVRNNLELEVKPNGTITKYIYDERNQLVEKIIDLGGLDIHLIKKRDSQGRIEAECDGENIWTHYVYNKRGEKVETTIDPDVLHLITRNEFDGLGKIRRQTKGDKQVEDQYSQTSTVDHLGRCIAQHVDPTGLDITTSNTFDAVGNITSVTDADGRVTRFYYDALYRERFHVTPGGEIVEKQYDAIGRCILQRSYARPFKSDFSPFTVKDWELALKDHASIQDAIEHYIYEEHKEPRFKIRVLQEAGKNPQGIVEEFVYDTAEREVRTIHYASLIDLSTDKSIKQQLDSQLVTLHSNPKNRTQHRWYDQASQERFVIDQSGKVVESRYDKTGKLIQVLQYTWIADIKLLSESTLDELTSKIVPKPGEDRITNYVYDSLGRRTFKISPLGYVKKYSYDKNNKRIATCRFKDKIIIPANYDELVVLVNGLVPDKTKDSISEVHYDHAGDIEKTVDPLGYVDVFKRNALGSMLIHTDRYGKEWEMEYDRAQRLIRQYSTESTIPCIQKQEDDKLVYTTVRTRVIKKTDYNKVGDTIAIIDAEKIDEATGVVKPRLMKLDYDWAHRLTQTTIPPVTVAKDNDDAAQVEVVEIKTQTLFNGLGKKVGYCNENGIWDFYIYDTVGRLICEIKKQTKLIKYKYNSFGQIVKEHSFANSLNLDILKTVKTITQEGTLLEVNTLPESPDDRVLEYDYDDAGNLYSVKKNAVFFCSDGKSGYAQPETKYYFNQFGNIVKECQLIHPGVWAEKYFWFDIQGHVTYQVDELKYVTFFERDAVGNEIKRIEFANAIEGEISEKINAEQLAALIIPNPQKDITYVYRYDQRDDKTEDGILEVVSQEVTIKDSIPHMHDLPSVRVKKAFTYSPTRKLIDIRYEDGSIEKKYYDERDFLVAELGVTRTSKDNDGTLISITPLTRSLYDAFGQKVVVQTSDKTAEVKEDGSLPVFTDISKVFEQLELKDSRGLTEVFQDSNKGQKLFTYTRTKKIATETQPVTVWVKDKEASFSTKIRKDKRTFLYNAADKPIRTRIYRDDIIEQQTYAQYNLFDEFIGEGEELGKLELYQKIDTSGRAWASNMDGGGHAIHLHNLLGQQTVRLQSDEVDLSSYDISQLPELLSRADSLQLTNSTLDSRGRIIEYRSPYWFRDKKPQPTRAYQYDRWDNILCEWDSRSALTAREFDRRNLLIKVTLPSVSSLQDDGNTTDTQPITIYGYNKRGFLVGSTDAKMHTECFVLDEAGQRLEHILADGTVEERRIFDALSRPLYIFDANNKKTSYQYDALGNPIWMQFPSKRISYFTYDEKNNRIMFQDAGNMKYRFNYDARQHCIERYTPTGLCTVMSYDRNHQLLTESAPGQSTITWKRDYFGKSYWHQDLGLRETRYEYTYRGKLKHQWGAGGYGRMTASLTPSTFILEDGVQAFHVKNDTPSQDIHYDYVYGLNTAISDLTLDRITTYEYDSEQLRQQLEIKTKSTGILLRRVTTIHDALNRELATADAHMVFNGLISSSQVRSSYDAVNNLRKREILLDQPRYTDKCPRMQIEPVVHWNTFDAASRVLVLGGHQVAPSLVDIVPGQGVKFTYQGMLRKAESTQETTARVLTTSLDYDDDNQLKLTVCSQTGLSTDWDYHDSGWIKTQRLRLSDGSEITRTLQLDDSGYPVVEEYSDKNLKRRTEYENYDNGLPKIAKLYDIKAEKKLLEESTTAYTGSDVLQVSSVTRSLTIGRKGQAEFWYDPNNTISFKRKSDDEPLGLDKEIIYFDTTTDGWVLNKQYFEWSRQIVGDTSVKPSGAYHFLYNVQGKPYGAYFALYNRRDANSDVRFHRKAKGNEYRHHPVKMTGIKIYSDIRAIGNYYPPDTDAKCDPLGGDFVNYSLPMMEQIHIVKFGDTLESISQEKFGDDYYAGEIAKHNALIMGHRLAPGYMLKIPRIIPWRVKAHTARPYNEFVNLLRGHLIPHVQLPRPKMNDASEIASVAKIVAIGIVICVAPQLAHYVLDVAIAAGILTSATAETATATAIATGVVAATGDAMVQGAAIGLGAQSRFSTMEMLEVGISAGALSAANFSQATQGALSARMVGIAKEALYIGTVQISTQLTEMAAGLRSHFDAKSVALQVAAAITGTQISAAAKGLFGKTPIATAASNMATTTSSALLGRAVTHTPIRIQEMAAQALGSTISDEVGAKIVEKIKVKTDAGLKPTARPTTHHSPAPHYRPLTAHERHTMLQAEEAAHMWVDEPGLDVGDASYRLSEMNRARMRTTPKIVTRLNSSKSILSEDSSLMRGVTSFNASAERYLVPTMEAVLAGVGIVAGAPVAFPLVMAGLDAYGVSTLAAIGIPVTGSAIAESTLVAGTSGALLKMGYTRAKTAVSMAKSRYTLFGEKSLINTGGRQLTSTKAVLSADREAFNFYIQVRASKSNADVIQISKNTGIPEYRIQRIKEHIFINEHILSGGRISQFDPYIEISDAWSRLQSGHFVEQDIQLLHHEYFEARFEGIFKTDYTTAHNAAINSGRTWNPEDFATPTPMVERRY